MKRTLRTTLAASLVVVAACGDDATTGGGGGGAGGATGSGGAGNGGGVAAYDWGLPVGVPTPRVPEDNPMTDEKVQLGRHLFYDARLSLNETQSCATCHAQADAFTDGRAQGLGSTGELHLRSPMSLTNVAYLNTLTWANPSLVRLEDQAMVPLFGEFPVELGFSGQEDELLGRLVADPKYVSSSPLRFPGLARSRVARHGDQGDRELRARVALLRLPV